MPVSHAAVLLRFEPGLAVALGMAEIDVAVSDLIGRCVVGCGGIPPGFMTFMVADPAKLSTQRQPGMTAVLEAWLAIASDPGMRAEIGPVAEFPALVSPDAMRTVLTSPERRDDYLMARQTMLGLVLGRATGRGRPLAHERAVLSQLRRTAATLESPS